MLVRSNTSNEELSDTEVLELVPSSIIDICNNINSKESAEEVIESLADILELVQLYSKKKNIEPSLVVQVAQRLHSEVGTFSTKK